MKYWNKQRIARVKERERRAAQHEYEKSLEEIERKRTYTKGDHKKNARLMLDALALPLRRQMIARLAKEGSMSLTKLSEPFRITLPAAQFHLGILERSGIVETDKVGRHRFVSFNKKAFAELASFLTTSPKDLS